MSKTLWVIFILGFLAVVFVILGMLFTLDAAKDSRAELAKSIRERFGFEEVSAWVKEDPGRTVLFVYYTTSKNMKSDTAAQDEEMALVGKHVEERYNGKDMDKIDQFRMMRTERRGRGCWQESSSREWSAPNPKKKPFFRPRIR